MLVRPSTIDPKPTIAMTEITQSISYFLGKKLFHLTQAHEKGSVGLHEKKEKQALITSLNLLPTLVVRT